MAIRFRGAGDVVAAVAKVTGIARVAAHVARKRGKKVTKRGNCVGCLSNQRKLNRLIPFG